MYQESSKSFSIRHPYALDQQLLQQGERKRPPEAFSPIQVTLRVS